MKYILFNFFFYLQLQSQKILQNAKAMNNIKMLFNVSGEKFVYFFLTKKTWVKAFSSAVLARFQVGGEGCF